ncbi:MAG TPA: hypothetical protein VK577_03120 [Bradyrhizobium sp.]|nr:hypothetical protein [Bradyrhizobium sp.]
MKIVRARPPLFDLIDAKFNVLGKPILFSWGDKIYIPTGSLDVSPALMAHEQVHGTRQSGGARGDDANTNIAMWWVRYMEDINFRCAEEVLAHRAEYRHLCDHAGGRNQRRRHLSIIATKLSHPLYGPMMNKASARKVLSDGDAANP